MDLALILGLLVLALIDSTSIGTLVIPVWLLLSPRRPPARRVVAYLLAIAGFYLAAGVVLLALAAAGVQALGAVADEPAVRAAQLAAGVGLIAFSFRFDSKARRERGEPDRVTRWRDRALSETGSSRALVGVAWAAGTLELLTMLPYLAAIGLLVSADPPLALYVPVLALYCLVMVAPALVLLAVRAAAAGRVDPLLRRVDGFFSRHADSAVGWAIGIAGFLIARDAAAHLSWFDLG